MSDFNQDNTGLHLSEEQARMKKEAENMQLVLDCPLCDAHGLHVIGKGKIETRQCLNCGYATSPKYIGERETNEMFKTLPAEMQKWSEEADGRIWIPAIITLPFGMLYPCERDNMVNHKMEIVWSFAEMIDIPEEKQKDYPIEGQEGKYHDRMYDTENPMTFKSFLEGFTFLNEVAKSEAERLRNKMPGTEWPQEQVKDIKLPKLNKQ